MCEQIWDPFKCLCVVYRVVYGKVLLLLPSLRNGVRPISGSSILLQLRGATDSTVENNAETVHEWQISSHSVTGNCSKRPLSIPSIPTIPLYPLPTSLTNRDRAVE